MTFMQFVEQHPWWTFWFSLCAVARRGDGRGDREAPMTPRDPSNPKDRPMTTCNINRTFGGAYVVTVPCFDNGDVDVETMIRGERAIALAALESGDYEAPIGTFVRKALGMDRPAMAALAGLTVADVLAWETQPSLNRNFPLAAVLDLLRASDRGGFVARLA